MCSSNDVASRAEGVRLDLYRFSLRIEVFCVFPQYIKERRPRPRWVDNIRMDLQEVGCGYVDWIGLA